MKVLVTGARGFVGRNLAVRLGELGHVVLAIGREEGDADWIQAAREADAVVHLAGVNRPADPAEFEASNVGLTRRLCELLSQTGGAVPILYASSTQAATQSPYGRSKATAELILLEHAATTGADVAIFRLPNVFGKWTRIGYNSAVATFCHRTARGEAIEIHNPSSPLQLVYVDDVIDTVTPLLSGGFTTGQYEVSPIYETTVGQVAEIIQGFSASRDTLVTPRVGKGLVRALYSTYISYLPIKSFDYKVPIYTDSRGRFVEMLKTVDSGQFSYFTACPGITRGGHYHHSKVEKFLVVSGRAQFGFRNIETGERHEILVEGTEGRIVETIPGWTHNITNTGEGDLVVMLWANENFDRSRADTIAMEV